MGEPFEKLGDGTTVIGGGANGLAVGKWMGGNAMGASRGLGVKEVEILGVSRWSGTFGATLDGGMGCGTDGGPCVDCGMDWVCGTFDAGIN